MAISDPIPERRNLILASIAFLVFFWGGGFFEQNEVRIQAINISFENDSVLGVFAWVMILWFFLRYWQTYRGELKAALAKDAKTEGNNPLLIWYLKHKTKKPYRRPGGFVLDSLTWNASSRFIVRISLVKGGREGPNGVWIEYKTPEKARCFR